MFLLERNRSEKKVLFPLISAPSLDHHCSLSLSLLQFSGIHYKPDTDMKLGRRKKPSEDTTNIIVRSMNSVRMVPVFGVTVEQLDQYERWHT